MEPMQTQYRISDNNIKGIQFGNFKYCFKEEKQLPIIRDTDTSVINTIEIYTCDNIPVVSISIDHMTAIHLYRDFVRMFRDKDTITRDLQCTNNMNIPRIIGSFDIDTNLYLLEFEMKSSYNGFSKSVSVFMNDDDFGEFIFLFYFHFIISYGII